MTSLLLLNGPNLNMLGTREPEIYGRVTLADVEAATTAHARDAGLDLACFQSNHEGALIDALHEARGKHAGVIFNAGAYTHTSIALHDAIVASELPVIEVHISNVHAREHFRHTSLIAPVTLGQIVGFGTNGYLLAVDALAHHLGSSK